MGAASDIIRMIQVVVQNIGIYSDFDVEIDLRYLNGLSIFMNKGHIYSTWTLFLSSRTIMTF